MRDWLAVVAVALFGVAGSVLGFCLMWFTLSGAIGWLRVAVVCLFVMLILRSIDRRLGPPA